MADALKPLVPPAVNLNGSSKQSLLDAHVAASRAVDAAIDALSKIAPNGRDYQTRPEGEFDEAREAWRERMALLKQMSLDIYNVAIAIERQGR